MRGAGGRKGKRCRGVKKWERVGATRPVARADARRHRRESEGRSGNKRERNEKRRERERERETCASNEKEQMSVSRRGGEHW